MKKVYVRDLYENPDNIGGAVRVFGWVRAVRAAKNLAFIELNDGSCFKSLQIVAQREETENYEVAARLGVGAAVGARGIIKATPGAKQPFELAATNLAVLGASPPDYPLQKKRHSFEFLRTMPHLRARTATFSAVFRVRSLAAYAIHKFFNERGFVYVQTPIITANDCEGAGELFGVTTMDMKNVPVKGGSVDYSGDFFGQKAGLTVSGQLEGEAYALAFGNVYTFGPTFRAEDSNTTRHAAEFWMVEPEVAFADLGDIMRLAEDMLKFVIQYLLANGSGEIEFLGNFIDGELYDRLKNTAEAAFARISYDEAVEILLKSGEAFSHSVEWGRDLQTEHERYISETVFGRPVFITDYPKEIKAFYMRQNDDGKTVAAMDLLVPGVGELIGGSQREERLDILREKIKSAGLSAGEYEWYLDLRRFGGAPHSGFGLGFERLLMYATGMKNIRDVISFPRTPGNIK